MKIRIARFRAFLILGILTVLAACIPFQPMPAALSNATKTPEQQLTVTIPTQIVEVRTPEQKPSASTPTQTPLTPVQPPSPTKPAVSKAQTGVLFGIYDPEDQLNDLNVTVEHIYNPWRYENADEFTSAIQKVKQKGRLPLVGVEPWPWEWNGMTKDTLFQDIQDGMYDPTIQTLCKAFAKEAPQELWIRWGHEMDIPDLFPWGQNNPEGFIMSYRHFVNTCRAEGATNVRFIWSPAGHKELHNYWPGAEYVDYIGLTLLEYPEWRRLQGDEEVESFEVFFSERYNRVKMYDKPVIICELGIAGDDSQKSEWLQEAYNAYSKFPLLRGVVYFNAVNPVPWTTPSGEEIGKPDWRITSKMFPYPSN